MAVIYRCVVFSTAIFLGAGFVCADPIGGLTYTYDFSQADPFTGFFTAPHPDAAANDTDDASDPSAVTSKGVLADGDLGDPVFTNPPVGCCLFNNGTYAGFRNDGAGGAPQPKIDVDLGGMFDLNSFTLHYLVEDRPSIYAPQTIRNTAGDIIYNGLTVSGSTDGEDFTELGFYNDFVPVFGPGGDFGTDVAEIRTATIDLTGSTASHISIDIRTPWSWIFLSEIVVDGTSVGGLTGDHNGDGSVDAADYVVWRKNDINGQQGYDDWRMNFGSSLAGGASIASAVPEPGSILLCGLGLLVLGARKCR
ncbi:MAG: PEP-CTERM sorting domain-containing protein [Pirellulales bacterium]